jgi:hypothetical protein
VLKTLRPSLLLCLLAGLAGGSAFAVARPQEPPESLPLDMSVWHRRDYSRCSGYGRVQKHDNILTIAVDDSALKYWQIPTLIGPLPINEQWGWVRRCDRPPASFAIDAREQAEADGIAIMVEDFPYVTWRWRVDGTIDDAKTADKNGKIRGAGDDFAAKVGIQMTSRETGELRELAYVWTRTIPENTTLVQEAGALFWKYKFYRIVAESGEDHVGEWRAETRNFLEDFRRIWPDEEPGVLLRVFLMTDGDNTESAVAADYADLVLHRSPPAQLEHDR